MLKGPTHDELKEIVGGLKQLRAVIMLPQEVERRMEELLQEEEREREIRRVNENARASV